MSYTARVDDAIDALLSAGEDRSDPPPRRLIVEELLTVGYAEVLDLEAERLRVAQRLTVVLEAHDTVPDSEVADLRARLTRVSERLKTLRTRLGEVNRRFGAAT
jgi:hypothetical protein